MEPERTLPSEAHEPSVGQLAIRKGLVSKERLEECKNVQRALARAGTPRPLWDILVERRALTREQADALRTESRLPGPDTLIAGFDVIARIGQGAMGVVYKARQRALDKIVALKILAPHLARDVKYIERFLREARAAGQLNHANVVRGIDVGESNGFHYFAMEFVEGETLYDRIKREGRLPERTAIAIAHQIARGLDHASRRGIVHRDVKPGNVLLTAEGVAKLADLGLARQLGFETDADDGALGTPNYIAPEQARGEPDVDSRADVYSLGATLYHLLTGKPPFTGPTAAVIMTKHLTDPVRWPEDATGVSAGARAIVEWAMGKDRARRYQRPADLAADLTAVLENRAPNGPILDPEKLAELLPGETSMEAIPEEFEPQAEAAPEKARPLSWIALAAGAALLALVILLLPRGDKPPADAEKPKPETPTLPPISKIQDPPPEEKKPPVEIKKPPIEAKKPEPAPKNPGELAWEETQAFDFAHPLEPGAALQRYRNFLKAHAASPLAETARRRITALERPLQSEAAKSFEGPKTEALRSLRGGRLSEALGAISAVPKNPKNPLLEEARRTARSEILSQAGLERVQAVAEARRHLSAKDRTGAAASLAIAEGLTPAEAPTDDLEDIRAGILAIARDIEAAARRKALLESWRKASAASEEARGRLASLDFEGAAVRLETAAREAGETFADRLRREAQGARAAAEAWRRIRAAAPTLAGTEARVNGAKVRIAAVEGDSLLPAGMARKPLTSLDADTLLRLAGGTDPRPSLVAGVGILLDTLGRSAEAEKLFADAGDEGRACLALREARSKPPPEISAAVAEEALEPVREAIRQQDADEARKRLAEARRQDVQKNLGPDGEAKFAALESEIDDLEAADGPGPRTLPNGRTEYRFRFRDASELDALRKPDAWGILKGTLVLLPGRDGWGQPIRSKEAFEGDVSAELDWIPTADASLAISCGGAHAILAGNPLKARLFEGIFVDGPSANSPEASVPTPRGGILHVRLARAGGRVRLTSGDDSILDIPARPGGGKAPLALRLRKSSAVRALAFSGKAIPDDDQPAAPAGLERGLRAAYFKAPNLQPGTRVLVRTDPKIDFDWGLKAPGAGVPVDAFSARWTGRIWIPATGEYQFATESDDGARFVLDQSVLIEDWKDHSRQRKIGPKSGLIQGFHNIRVEYYDRTGGAVMRLLWKPPGKGDFEVVPAERLFHAAGSGSP
ncbi:MAG: protein kinase [Planctomycetota bacterium]